VRPHLVRLTLQDAREFPFPEDTMGVEQWCCKHSFTYNPCDQRCQTYCQKNCQATCLRSCQSRCKASCQNKTY
jgi:hypothetical protein